MFGLVIVNDFVLTYGLTPLCSDLYEGTRMATVADLPGIKQLLQPLEESGTLIRRTKEEVCSCNHNLIFYTHYTICSIAHCHICILAAQSAEFIHSR